MLYQGKPHIVSRRIIFVSFALMILTVAQTVSAQDSTPTKAPVLANTSGPDVSLQNSEALFDFAVALNSCGYDQGLAASDPIRQEVRDQVNQALQTSADAREAHEQICAFIAQHRLPNSGSDLAQYIS